MEESPNDPNALRDVMPERFSRLEKELVRGKGEMVSRSLCFRVHSFRAAGVRRCTVHERQVVVRVGHLRAKCPATLYMVDV